MGTTLRPELSEKNKYYVERHRYYELKHFCLQYPIWKQTYAALEGLQKRPDDLTIFVKTNQCSNPTLYSAMTMMEYNEKMEMIEQCAIEADSYLYPYLLKGITEGLSFEHMNARELIPCSKDTYYDRYRKFFWLLNRTRK